MKALKRYGRTKEADAVADTLIAAAKGLMRSGEDHVTKAKFEEQFIDWSPGRLIDVLTFQV